MFDLEQYKKDNRPTNYIPEWLEKIAGKREWDIICASDSKSGNVENTIEELPNNGIRIVSKTLDRGWMKMFSKSLGEWFYYRGAPYFDIIG